MNLEEENNVLAQAKSEHMAFRWFGLGARPEELFETFSRINMLSDWCKEFCKTAQRFEKAADTIKDGLVKASNYLTAATYYHIGELCVFEDNEEKIQAYNSILRVYDKARKHFWRPVERVEYPFAGVTFSAYFRKVPSVEKAPCVLLLRGIDACRELGLHTISDFLLEKGLSTLAIDTSGQGETRLQGLKMTPDVKESVAAALDYLEKRPDVDSSKIGILGQSFGGYIAVRTASQEKRIKACVCLGSFYGLDEFDTLPVAKYNCLLNMKITEAEWPQTRSQYSLKGVIDKMTCHLLVVNGSDDVVCPISQSIKLYESARCPKDLKVYQGAKHLVYYENKDVLSYIANWILAKLHYKGTN